MTDPSHMSDMSDMSDHAVWQRIRHDDPDAFGLLFRRHGPRIHGYVVLRTADPSNADDVVAMVFLEAWRKRHHVELTRSSALPWLYGVAANVLRSQRRTRRRHQRVIEQVRQLPPPSATLVEVQVEAAREACSVLDQIERLPQRDREVLLLATMEQLSHADIAAALGISEAAVKSRLTRARRRLDRDLPPDPSPRRPTRLTPRPTPIPNPIAQEA